jgi:hypothetical protein
MHQWFPFSRIDANRNGNLANTEDIEHIELPGGEWRDGASILRLEFQGEGIRHLIPHVLHAVELW